MSAGELQKRVGLVAPSNDQSLNQWQKIALETANSKSNPLSRPAKTSKFWMTLCETFFPYAEVKLDQDLALHLSRSVASFTYESLRCLPLDLWSMQMLGLTCFRFAVALQTGNLFENLPRARRQDIVDAYAFGRVHITRKLFRPVRSLVLLAYFEDPLVILAMSEKNTLDAEGVIQQIMLA